MILSRISAVTIVRFALKGVGDTCSQPDKIGKTGGGLGDTFSIPGIACSPPRDVGKDVGGDHIQRSCGRRARSPEEAALLGIIESD